MKLADLIEKVSQNAASWLVVSLLGGIVWLVRRVFTNQQQIELLQQSLNHHREDLKEVKDNVQILIHRTTD
jgi:hypothetical protein